jgi:signal peptidase I
MADLNSALGSLAGSTTKLSTASSEKNRHLVSALLSSVFPGAGQFILGEKRRAAFLLATLLCLCLGFWPLRAPRVFAGYLFLSLLWISLYVYSSCNALVARARSTTIRPSTWWLLLFIPLTLVAVRYTILPAFRMSGFLALSFSSSSMEPTILPGEKIIVDSHYYGGHTPERGDLLAFRTKEGFITIKRIIALGGDTIEGKDRQILANGATLKEPYTQHTLLPGSNPELDSFDSVLVPEGNYFVIGDNRDISLDSRRSGYGFVERKSIVGKALYVYPEPKDFHATFH